MIYQFEFFQNEAIALARTAEEWELITGQRYFKNACVGHVIDTARGEKPLL